mgnify:CR=1 FL=1
MYRNIQYRIFKNKMECFLNLALNWVAFFRFSRSLFWVLRDKYNFLTFFFAFLWKLRWYLDSSQKTIQNWQIQNVALKSPFNFFVAFVPFLLNVQQSVGRDLVNIFAKSFSTLFVSEMSFFLCGQLFLPLNWCLAQLHFVYILSKKAYLMTSISNFRNSR